MLPWTFACVDPGECKRAFLGPWWDCRNDRARLCSTLLCGTALLLSTGHKVHPHPHRRVLMHQCLALSGPVVVGLMGASWYLIAGNLRFPEKYQVKSFLICLLAIWIFVKCFPLILLPFPLLTHWLVVYVLQNSGDCWDTSVTWLSLNEPNFKNSVPPLHYPYFKCLVAPCGWQLPHWTAGDPRSCSCLQRGPQHKAPANTALHHTADANAQCCSRCFCRSGVTSVFSHPCLSRTSFGGSFDECMFLNSNSLFG